jgi:hypothetical protein
MVRISALFMIPTDAGVEAIARIGQRRPSSGRVSRKQ